jgi:hypothetical protein
VTILVVIDHLPLPMSVIVIAMLFGTGTPAIGVSVERSSAHVPRNCRLGAASAALATHAPAIAASAGTEHPMHVMSSPFFVSGRPGPR